MASGSGSGSAPLASASSSAAAGSGSTAAATGNIGSSKQVSAQSEPSQDPLLSSTSPRSEKEQGMTGTVAEPERKDDGCDVDREMRAGDGGTSATTTKGVEGTGADVEKPSLIDSDKTDNSSKDSTEFKESPSTSVSAAATVGAIDIPSPSSSHPTVHPLNPDPDINEAKHPLSRQGILPAILSEGSSDLGSPEVRERHIEEELSESFKKPKPAAFEELREETTSPIHPDVPAPVELDEDELKDVLAVYIDAHPSHSHGPSHSRPDSPLSSDELARESHIEQELSASFVKPKPWAIGELKEEASLPLHPNISESVELDEDVLEEEEYPEPIAAHPYVHPHPHRRLSSLGSRSGSFDLGGEHRLENEKPKPAAIELLREESSSPIRPDVAAPVEVDEEELEELLPEQIGLNPTALFTVAQLPVVESQSVSAVPVIAGPPSPARRRSSYSLSRTVASPSFGRRSPSFSTPPSRSSIPKLRTVSTSVLTSTSPSLRSRRSSFQTPTAITPPARSRTLPSPSSSIGSSASTRPRASPTHLSAAPSVPAIVMTHQPVPTSSLQPNSKGSLSRRYSTNSTNVSPLRPQLTSGGTPTKVIERSPLYAPTAASLARARDTAKATGDRQENQTTPPSTADSSSSGNSSTPRTTKTIVPVSNSAPSKTASSKEDGHAQLSGGSQGKTNAAMRSSQSNLNKPNREC